MTLHLLGIFHTLCQEASSHCAFTGKVFRFAKMMQARGYHVIEYANASTSACTEKVNILTPEELTQHSSRKNDSDFHGDDANTGTTLFRLFDERLRKRLEARVKDSDIICHPFGHCHSYLKETFPRCHHVETGIGYPTVWADFKVFESSAWMHYHQGKAGRGGSDYEWVIPNYFDIDEWQPSDMPGKYLLFFGRLVECKGLRILSEIAKHTKQPLVLCGQGDPTPWLQDNIHYLPPVTGSARSELLRNATALLMPTRYTEPFGGSGVEGMLCGTPLLSSDFGAFTETVQNGVNGFRCHTLGDWIEAIRLAPLLDRHFIATGARGRYSLSACGQRYDRVFNQINDLRDGGWYNPTPRNV